jgi:hypothetical protein
MVAGCLGVLTSWKLGGLYLGLPSYFAVAQMRDPQDSFAKNCVDFDFAAESMDELRTRAEQHTAFQPDTAVCVA